MGEEKIFVNEQIDEDIPEEVQELIDAGVPILDFSSRYGAAMYPLEQDEWYLRKYTEPYEWLIQQYPVQFSAEFRIRPTKKIWEKDLRFFYAKILPTLPSISFKSIRNIAIRMNCPQRKPNHS